jgi:hypothetical protein
MCVHRICVAVGALDRAEAETGTRALRIEPAVLNDAVRFTVGTTDKASGWVHVFDEESLATVLAELSTVTDFIHYLNSKVALTQTNFKFADAETDLLGCFGPPRDSWVRKASCGLRVERADLMKLPARVSSLSVGGSIPSIFSVPSNWSF